ncbi:MAG: hypothetical protein ACFCVC_07210 [Acidimicrobiia bacterium]
MEGSFGTYLNELLSGVSAYRAKWDLPDRVRRVRPGAISQSAVARTIAEHMAATGGPSRSSAAWKTLVWKSLGDHACTYEMLEGWIEVFAIDENPVHDYRLRSLHTLQFSRHVPPGPLPSERWVPEEVLARIGTGRRHRTVSVHESHTVGPDRQAVSHRSEQVIEAVRAGCDRYFFNYDAREVDLHVVSGGTVVGVYDTDGGLRCNEVAFGRTIPVGETHRFEIVATFRQPADLPPHVRRASADRLRRVSMQVCFDPANLPSEVRWAEWDTIGHAEPTFSEIVPLCAGGTAHRYVEQATRSVVGFTWTW